jgi:YggT family protein
MEEIMQAVFGFLATVTGIYSLLLFIRIIMSWFGGNYAGRPVNILTRITDPYLDWWRNKLNLRLGHIDLSVLVAIAFLSIAQNILSNLSRFGSITLGNILAIILMSVWSVTSFLLGFCIIILILRFIAYMTNRDMYTNFWRIIDSISQPLLYKINRLVYKQRIPNYVRGIVTSVLLLTAAMIGGGLAVQFLVRALASLSF